MPSSDQLNFASCAAFSFHKSGSTLAFNMLREMCSVASIPSISLPDMLFSRGISTQCCVVDYASFIENRGYCYLGFRGVPESMYGIVQSFSGPKALIVRDPRDMLVSLYFSVKSSHFQPENKTTQFAAEMGWEKNATEKSINQYCVEKCHIFLRQFDALKVLFESDLRVFKYEEFVYDKMILCTSLRDHFQIPISQSILQDIVSRYNEIPTEDQPAQHIRQVHPGDHRRKLNSSTIDILNSVLKDFLEAFDYKISA